MKKFKRIFVIVADSMGVGEAPDAANFGDHDVSTFGHIANLHPNFKVDLFEELGMGNIVKCKTVKPVDSPKAVIGKMQEISCGKDTLTGHFEMMGLKVTKPYPSFTDTGFPKELIDMLESYSGRKVLGNKAASGTKILKELGEEQIKTGALIIYTSSDSVLQIAANEEVIPLDELYDICAYARKITIERPEWQVGRIIARPYVGKTKDTFVRTTNRHDYALKPFAKTSLDSLKENGYDVIAIGKIKDIFDGEGITESFRTTSNHNGMERTIEQLDKDFTGLVFTNLVDFDALYGHRRNLIGYGDAIMEFDNDLKTMFNKLEDTDLVMITADHGNDPTAPGTDHTREFVPLICYHKNIKGKVIKEPMISFATIGQTICDNFEIEGPNIGKSILGEL